MMHAPTSLCSVWQAEYEKSLESAKATPEQMQKYLFPPPPQEPYARCLLAELPSGGGVIGMALVSVARRSSIL